jgi:hypothetical protein
MPTMETHVLVFPMAADDESLCLIEPEPWLHGPVQAGVGVERTVWAVLEGHGLADPKPLLVHSTSWHEVKSWHGEASEESSEAKERDGRRFPLYHQVDAYLAVLPLPGDCTVVEQRWPAAVPVDLEAMAQIALPEPHGPSTAPVEVMQAHALLHGLRHLALELGPYGDSELREALVETVWPGHLAELLGVLAHLYRHDLTGQPA